LVSERIVFPLMLHPFGEAWNVYVGRRYKFAGSLEVIATLKVEPEVTLTGKENSAHFPFGAISPIPLGGMLSGDPAVVVPIVEPKYVWRDTSLKVAVIASVVAMVRGVEARSPENGRSPAKGARRRRAPKMMERCNTIYETLMCVSIKALPSNPTPSQTRMHPDPSPQHSNSPYIPSIE